MLNKCNVFFALLKFKPKLLYRKKESFATLISLVINIIYIISLIAGMITLICHCYFRRIHSISSYYTPIPTNLSMAIEIQLLNKTTNQPIESSEAIVKVTMIDSRINSSELEPNSFSMKECKTTSIDKLIGSQYTYKEDIFLYRNENYYNIIGMNIEFCLNDKNCMLKSKDEILSQSVLKIIFPSKYYNPMEDSSKNNTKAINLELGVNPQMNDYFFIIEPQVVFEDGDVNFTSNNNQIKQISIYNNYEFHSTHKTKSLLNVNGYHMTFMLINYTSIIIIRKVNLICETIPKIISMFYLIKIVFKTIFKYSMQKLYDTDFEKHLIYKQNVIQKNNSKKYIKKFSLLFNNTTHANAIYKQNNDGRNFKPYNQTNAQTLKFLNNNSKNNNDLTNLNNSRVNIISKDYLLKTLDSKSNNNVQKRVSSKKQSLVISNLNQSQFQGINHNQSDNNINNPQTIIRFTPNMPYTFQENYSGKNVTVKNSSFEDNYFNNNSSQQQILNDNPCQLQPISLNINFNNNKSKINITKNIKESNKRNSKESLTKQKTFLYRTCCCFKMHVALKDISQILVIRTEIMKYASIDEIVSRLSFYETLFPKIKDLIESRKMVEASSAVINESDNNNHANVSNSL